MADFKSYVGTLSERGAQFRADLAKESHEHHRQSLGTAASLAQDRGHIFSKFGMRAMASVGVTGPALVVATATLPVAVLLSPVAIGVGAAAIVAAGVGLLSTIKGLAEESKAKKLFRIKEHFDQGGNDQSLKEELIAGGVGLRERLSFFRASQDARVEGLRQKPMRLS